jgi:hypothetical protein
MLKPNNINRFNLSKIPAKKILIKEI